MKVCSKKDAAVANKKLLDTRNLPFFAKKKLLGTKSLLSNVSEVNVQTFVLNSVVLSGKALSCKLMYDYVCDICA